MAPTRTAAKKAKVAIAKKSSPVAKKRAAAKKSPKKNSRKPSPLSKRASLYAGVQTLEQLHAKLDQLKRVHGTNSPVSQKIRDLVRQYKK